MKQYFKQSSECIKKFNCEKSSQFLKYETEEREILIDTNGQKKFAKNLIWGDIKDKDKIRDKLNTDVLITISENLRIYNKYNKYSFNVNKLIIIGDVLKNGSSLKQLYNLIQLKCKKIDGIIFKDNHKIPRKVFSDLMKQLFLIPKLKQISFISSVLDEKSITELYYLIQRKSVEYLILFRSYFLGQEIDQLLNIENSNIKLNLNHQRFTIIDVLQKKSYEFTPYSNFNDLILEKEEGLLFEVERLYIQQQNYPEQIYNQIIFFQDRLLSIASINQSDKILFKYWHYLNKEKEKIKKDFQQNQVSLIRILKKLFREDDINILNYNLIQTLIDQVIEEEEKIKFQQNLEKSKSFKYLKERFPLELAKKILFKKYCHLQICYSYLYGFTIVKEIGIYYIVNNQILHDHVRENNKQYLLNFFEGQIKIMFDETIPQDKQLLYISQCFSYMKIVNLQLYLKDIDQNISLLFLNKIFEACKSLKQLSLSSNKLSSQKLKGVDFSLVSDELEEFNINDNPDIIETNFFQELFKKAQKLKKLGIQKLSESIKIMDINFSLLSNNLQELDIGYNKITDIVFLNKIFEKIPCLKKIDLTQCSLNTELIKNIKFAPGLKSIIMDKNMDINLAALIVHIGQTKRMELEYISVFEIGKSEPYDYQGDLEAFSKLKKLRFEINDFSHERDLNLILSNNKLEITNLILKNSCLEKFDNLIFEDVYQNLEILDLSQSHKFKDFKFLEKILEKTTKLKTLNLSCCMPQNKQCDLDLEMEKIPNTLEEFYFSENSGYRSLNKLLNNILLRCQSLKILHIQNCALNDKIINDINWTQISTKLVDLNISINPDIQSYNFLKDIFNRSAHLQKVNLKENEIGQKLKQDNFDLLKNPTFEFIADKEDISQFQEMMIDKLGREVNFYSFQQIYSNNKNNNYFETFKLDIFSEKINCQCRQNIGKSVIYNVVIEEIQNKSLKEEELKEEQLNKNIIQRFFKMKDMQQSKIVLQSKDIKNNDFINIFLSNLIFLAKQQNKDSNNTNQNTSIDIEKIKQYLNQEFSGIDIQNMQSKFFEYLLNLNSDQTQNIQNGNNSEQKRKLIENLIKNKEKKEEENEQQLQNKQKIIKYFLSLLLNDVNFKSNFFQSDLFIFSPFSLFQQFQPKDIQCKDNEKLTVDSYNLAFFNLNMFQNRGNTKYIFSYNKYFFSEYSEFYVQIPNKEKLQSYQKFVDFFKNYKSFNIEEAHLERFEKLKEQLLSGSGYNIATNICYLQFIIDLKKKMDEHKIKKAFLPIRLNLSKELLKNKELEGLNLNEYRLLKLINSIPPAYIDLQGMSVQFVKSWYVINYYAPLSLITTIDVDYTLLENSSIANFFATSFYHMYVQNFEGETLLSKIKQVFGKRLYRFFNLINSKPKKFVFDHTVIHLEKEVKGQFKKGRYNILRVLFPFYIFISIFGVCFFSIWLDVTCGNGISWYSYIFYAVFGFITFIIEAYILNICLHYVSHLIPELKPNCLQDFPYNLINRIKLFIMDFDWINQWYVNYFISFVLSQVSRFDFFTNIGFLYTAYQCGDILVFTLAFISQSITTLICIIFFIRNLKKGNNKLVTGNIDKLYQICNLLEFQAVADVLDIVSPSNSVNLFGKMFNQRIVNSFLRILLQDIPFIIIQALYLFRKGVFNSTIIFSLTSSGFMFLFSLNQFLTIAPSRLEQEDFNQINTIKKYTILPNYLKNLSDYELQIAKFNFYELLKCIRSQKYLNHKLEELDKQKKNISPELKNNKIFMVQQLRYFEPNQDQMMELFGNLKYLD